MKRRLFIMRDKKSDKKEASQVLYLECSECGFHTAIKKQIQGYGYETCHQCETLHYVNYRSYL